MDHELKEHHQMASEKKLNAGIKLVHRTYGDDLSTFFNAVYAKLGADQKRSDEKIVDLQFQKYCEK